MGGNVKYRNRYVYYTDANGEKQVMRDSNGNPVKTGYPQYTEDGMRKLKSLNAKRKATGATNARERMLNSEAITQVRVAVKNVKKFNKFMTGPDLLKTPQDELKKISNEFNKNYSFLENLTTQIDSNVKRYSDGKVKMSEIERVLGVKLM